MEASTLTTLTDLTKARIADTHNQKKKAEGKLPTPPPMQTQQLEPHTGLTFPGAGEETHTELHLRQKLVNNYNINIEMKPF